MCFPAFLQRKAELILLFGAPASGKTSFVNALDGVKINEEGLVWGDDVVRATTSDGSECHIRKVSQCDRLSPNIHRQANALVFVVNRYSADSRTFELESWRLMERVRRDSDPCVPIVVVVNHPPGPTPPNIDVDVRVEHELFDANSLGEARRWTLLSADLTDPSQAERVLLQVLHFVRSENQDAEARGMLPKPLPINLCRPHTPI